MNITDQIIMPERDNESEITNKIRMVGRIPLASKIDWYFGKTNYVYIIKEFSLLILKCIKYSMTISDEPDV